ncbi:diaminopimelate epimerase [Frankia sp. R82]|uniref:diaminopimelate epimerase n=1 Tax=Frankia sp. R82 TaxID=2950553 RepID=UPI00204337A2|nr:diaminopimelate epimerase [Frankia sp. R82]MCM3885370.1 diaminopimelate epimerase [Frankia sp. R82]
MRGRPYDVPVHDDRQLRFVKGHGTGNDFVILPDPDGDLDLTPELVRALCDRRTGIGADGVLRVVLAAATADASAFVGSARWFMDYRNADGSLAQMCGNGARVFARYLVEAGYARPGVFVLATRAGLRRVEVPPDGDVTVEMGPPHFAAAGTVAPLVSVAGRAFGAVAVSMGNPHAVCFADDLDVVALRGLDLTQAPRFRADDFPEGVNVEIVVDRPGGGVAMRVYERGVGETASCGTGACAVAVAWADRHGRRPTAAVTGTDDVAGTRAGGAAGSEVEVAVDVPGGALTVRWQADSVLLRGPAELVFDGVVRPGAFAGGGPISTRPADLGEPSLQP